MTSDETTRQAPDVPFQWRGFGMNIKFRCGRCAEPGCDKKGSGMRHVAGLRTYVCKSCKDQIDAGRNRA